MHPRQVSSQSTRIAAEQTGDAGDYAYDNHAEATLNPKPSITLRQR